MSSLMESPIEAVAPARRAASDAEFRDRTIYFVVLDRFHSGIDSNNGRNQELNDPTRQDWHKYWGGDLQGLYDKLDYLRGLGINAIWVTPLFEQIESYVFENDRVRAPIHGYWTQDFKRINARWVNDESEIRVFSRNDTIFDRLLGDMHSRGMKFILDFVCNHSSPAAVDGKGRLYDDGVLIADFNEDQAAWYHHYGEVQDWNDDWQVQNCEVAGLATFNENCVEYRRYIKDAAKAWIDKGVDALRIDTVKHMPLWFWQEFNADLQLHKPDLFLYGEWIDSSPYDERALAYANSAGMSIIDFGMCYALRDVFAVRRPEGFLVLQALLNADAAYRNSTELVTCFETHDMPRFQSLNADPNMLHLAIVALMTSRGIPTLFYGCEQYLHNDTDGGHDPYNRPMMTEWGETEAGRLIGILAREREVSPAIQFGGQWVRSVDPDVICYERVYRDSTCLVILNRGEERDIAAAGLDMPDGDYTCILTGETIAVRDRALNVRIPSFGARVLSRKGPAVQGRAVAKFQVNAAPVNPGERLAVIGSCPELGNWDLRYAYFMDCVNANCWFGEVPFEESAGQTIAYKYVIFRPDSIEQPVRESRVARRRGVPEDGDVKWRDWWEH
ncbi:alpha-amylase [Bryobacterales bacterium F-183]|nr:alpha-amylase [Bryobacterales bacterium F-183]